MPRGRTVVVLLATLALFAGGTAVSDASGRTSVGTTVTRVAPLEQLLLQQVNAVRTANGLGALTASPALTRAAALHSRAMATFGFFAHESRDGGSFAARVGRFYRPGTRGWTIGENLAMFGGTIPSAEAIVAAWMGSPGHRAILLRRAYREAGIAIVHNPAAGGVFGGQPTWVVTLDVGTR